MSSFVKAERKQRKLRAAFDGPPGSGKSYTALRLAFCLVKKGMAKKVAAIDTENSSISLYAGSSPDGASFDFDTLNLTRHRPQDFVAAMKEAFKEGYDVVVVDSLSHAWVGKDGALDQKDAKGGNSFTAWKDITPIQREMVDTIITAPAHMICTMRSKTEYVLEEDEKGKKVPRKIGMAPVQRDGLEYEFDVYGSIDHSHQLRISKTRCDLFDNKTDIKPGYAFWEPFLDWMSSAAPVDPSAPVATFEAPDYVSTLIGSLANHKTQGDAMANGFGDVVKNYLAQGKITPDEKQVVIAAFQKLPK